MATPTISHNYNIMTVLRLKIFHKNLENSCDFSYSKQRQFVKHGYTLSFYSPLIKTFKIPFAVGCDRFKVELETLTGRRLKSQKRGRPAGGESVALNVMVS